MLTDISYPPIPGLDLGLLEISLHGAFAGIGIAVGLWMILRRVRRDDIADPELVISFFAWAVVGALIGIRLFTIPARIGDPGYGWSDVFDPSGSYSMLGGLTGALLLGGLRARYLGLPVARLLDISALPLALGQAIGRLGDLAIVEHLGSPTSFLLGYRLQPGYDVAGQHDALEALCELGACGPYHHTALYDLLGLMILALVLRRLAGMLPAGSVIAVWAAWYGLQRFMIDFTRLGAARDGLTDDSVIWALTASQWGGLAVASAAIVGLAVVRRASRSPSRSEIP